MGYQQTVQIVDELNHNVDIAENRPETVMEPSEQSRDHNRDNRTVLEP